MGGGGPAAYFTDPDRYTRWMGVDAVLEAEPGGVYRVTVPQGWQRYLDRLVVASGGGDPGPDQTG